MIDNPITRKEKYLAKLTGSYTGNVPDPITRVEKYLYDLCQKGISGLTPEEIENAVNKYLEGKDYVTKTDADKLYQPAGSYLSGTDEDLAVSGKAADAKAVGNAVAKIEGINYTNRGTLADTDAFLINDGTGMKKSVLSKLSDFVLDKIADKVFAKLQTNDKTILGAINELNSKTPNCTYMSPQVMINSNAWCEIATFSSNIWNRSFFTLVCGGDICAINYGHEQDSNEYLSRCNAIWLTNKDIKVGFKVLDNILHIYIKNDRVTRFISICCLGLCTENDITSFKLRNTTLEDADMDKIY